jgi:hypothetical protein
VWIRIGFSVDPNPAFYANAEPDSGSQINADPLQALASLKAGFLYEKYTLCR